MNTSQESRARDAARYGVSHATHRMLKRVGMDASRAAKSAGSFDLFLQSLASNLVVFVAEFSAPERFARAVNDENWPIRGKMAATLLETISREYKALAEDGGASTLVARVDKLRGEQLLRLPQVMVSIFVQPDPNEVK